MIDTIRWRWFLLGGLVLLGVVDARAGLDCSAEVDRRTVAPGGQIVLTLHARGDGRQQPQHPRPSIDGVEVVPGGTSQSYHFVNGKAEHALDATYYLVVRRDDDFRIPAVTFTAGDETCATDPIAITVRDGGGAGGRGRRTTPAPGGPGARAPVVDSGPQAGTPGDPYFITLSVDRDEVWVGQQIVLTFRYHYRKSPWNQPSYTAPRTEGFWRVDLPPERNYRRTIGGRVYDVTEIRYALFPTRAGDLVVEPARLEIAGDPFDRFFGRRSRGPLRLATAPIAVTVRELPQPRPDRFSGIVADKLAFTATVDQDTVPRGEPVSLRLSVEADGFLKSFAGVPLSDPPGARLHDASESLREDVNGPRYRAVFIQEKAAVPTEQGTLRFPPLELVYFDTGQGRYRAASAELPAIVVTPSDLPVAGDDPSGFRRSEIARLGNDLAFIHPLRGSVDGPSLPRIGGAAWWSLLLAPWLLLTGYGLHRRRVAADRRDPVSVRRRRALGVARRRLGEAEAADDADLLARAILGFVADRLGRNSAAVTAADVESLAAAAGRPDAGRRLREVLAACDQARFGGAGALDVTALAREASALLPGLTAGRRGGAARATIGAGALLLLLAVGSPAAADPAATPAPGADPARLMAEGNQAYTEGDLERALARYRGAIRRGGDAADLHYNLGNAHARRGELGRAIVSYLRALRRAPRDADIRRNLEWVRSHTRDLELADQKLPPVIAQLDRAAHWLAVREWGVMLLVLSWLAVAPVAVAWRRGDVAPGLRRLIIAAVVLLVFVGVITATRWYEEHGRDTAVVVVDEVEVRSGPATTFPVVFRVHDGLTVEIRGAREGWQRIGLGGDWVGWVPAGTLVAVRQGR